jgi:hypothetical protein
LVVDLALGRGPAKAPQPVVSLKRMARCSALQPSSMVS